MANSVQSRTGLQNSKPRAFLSLFHCLHLPDRFQSLSRALENGNFPVLILIWTFKMFLLFLEISPVFFLSFFFFLSHLGTAFFYL